MIEITPATQPPTSQSFESSNDPGKFSVTPPNLVAPSMTPSAAPTRSVRWWIVAVAVLMIGLGLVYAYQQRQTQDAGQMVLDDNASPNGQQNQTTSTPSATAVPTYNRQELLLTTQVDEKGDGSKVSYEHWLLNLAGGQKTKLVVPDSFVAYKYPDSPLVFFTKTTSENSIFVKNIVTEEVKEYQVITHPRADVNEGVAIGDLKSIAPDGSFVIYSTFFSIPCPPVSIPPGFEGGFGPCVPDPDPSLPMGYYLYDIVNKTNTYLGGSTIVSTWDLAGKKLYFNDIDSNRGLKVLDLTTKNISIFDEAKTFGYGAYPVLGRNNLIKIEGETGNEPGESSSVVLSLTNLQTGDKQTIDSGRWADIQPFASIAPDESLFLYQRTKLDAQGRAIGSLYVYDFTTSKTRQLTPDDGFYYSIHGYWSNAGTFITTRQSVGDGDRYTNLVQIRLSDGLVTPIFENVFRFIQN